MFLIIVNIFIFFKIRSSNSFPSKLGILSTPYKHNFALHYKLYLQYEINKQEPRTYYPYMRYVLGITQTVSSFYIQHTDPCALASF